MSPLLLVRSKIVTVDCHRLLRDPKLKRGAKTSRNIATTNDRKIFDNNRLLSG